MSRTREIAVYVQSKILTDEDSTVRSVRPMYNPFDGEDVNLSSGWVKARIIIELPERKVTISESEFYEAWKIAGNSDGLAFIHIKEKLFREDK